MLFCQDFHNFVESSFAILHLPNVNPPFPSLLANQEVQQQLSMEEQTVSPVENSMLVSTENCRVCGAAGGGRHYSSVCCSGCKGFFRRSIRFQKVYKCPYDQQCAVSKEYRNSCRACRLAKCLAEGMNPEMVKKDQPQGSKRQKPLPSEHSEESADEKKVKQEHSGHPEEAATSTSATGEVVEEPEFGEVLDALLHHYRRLNGNTSSMALGFGHTLPAYQASDSRALARHFLRAEQFCDLFVDMIAPSAQQFQPNLEVPVELAMRQPGLVAPRISMCWDARNLVMPERMLRVYSRSIVHYFDWVSHFPEMTELSDQDRHRLVTKRLTRCGWLLCAQRSAKFRTPGLTFGVDCFFPVGKRQSEMDQRMVEMLGPRMELAALELVAPFTELAISEEEYALLRVMCLFTPVSRLSTEGHELVQRCQNKCLNALTELVFRQSEPHPSGMAPQWRMNRLLLMLAMAEQLGQLDDDVFQLLNFFNIVGIQGTLLYDVHMRA